MELSGLKKVGTAVVTSFPKGRDDESRRTFKDLLKALVRDANYPRIVVDLEDVTFFSSLDLGVLVFALQEAKERKKELAVVCKDPRILQVFEATKMDGVFDIHDSVDAAAGK